MSTTTKTPRSTALMRRRLALLVAPLLMVSCVFGRGSKDEPTVTVRVQNSLVPPAALTISLLPATGARRTIGVVGPSRTEELRFPLASSGDPHRLLAEAGTGPATASRQFTLASASVVEWNVGLNTLNVAARR